MNMKIIWIIVIFNTLCYTLFSQTVNIDNFIVDRFIDTTGREIIGIIVPGIPPEDGFKMPVAAPTESSTILADVPGYDWSFGCSATSGAMMAGYYDRTDYSNIYVGPTNGGIAPLDNSIWGGVVINGEYRKQCPISATRNGVDGRTIRGHVDDYWIEYGNNSDDPWISNGWTEHSWGNCTGDYMGTNQSSLSNSDGSTTFYNYPSGAPLYNYDAPSGRKDGCYGLRAFFESCGYTVNLNYNQYIFPYGTNTQGFTFDQYKQEIDAGRPVFIQVTGHSMLGYGYDDNGQTIYLRDTWDYSQHSMSWGGSYSGMTHYGVTVIQLATVPYLTLSPTSNSVSYSSGSYSISVNSNVAWVVSESCSWLTISNGSGSNNGTFTVNYSANTSDSRSYDIIVSGGGVSETHVINQAAAILENLTIQNETITNGETECFNAINTVTVAGSETTVDIQSGGEATFIAGETIYLKPGFHSHSGSTTQAYITTTGDYCSSLPPIVENPGTNEKDTEANVIFDNNTEVKIFPNPTTGNFTIDFMGEETTADILLLNFQGATLLEKKCKDQMKIDLDIAYLPTGIYILVIKTKTELITKKIIKNY